ncbi:putative 2-succinyl-6-hydroxy-2,4-cyclohexadiene-1-carboxylate synthase [Pseudonocardia sulfidoxydans NBRC 16205]|uniref:Putative 2-succinyl-6-hydroxy-2,4-cyclohexadiene-1-carboxylate synthase n=2 Tax=Pseudonocardia sulfidoxydans TaxID=54011 RepID=A0A511DGE5_9PSEU|nr:alpha/beta hydrolase [Pseudonocardia sulfidoxydans]GEL23860.1 putative 2-succinyl-6-hydroxy-2,4-cyclohexadiene-1-carboxylate synthase [Pseudonocardia sulfidoxydans NBRC 16205]
MAESVVNGVRLHHETVGSGPPLLLVAGLGSSSAAWAGAVPVLAERFSVTTVDNRGTGRSDVPPGPYAIDEMADDVAALVDRLGIGPVPVVGWSMGGSITQSLLVRHPETLSRAVLLSAFPSYTRVQDAWLDAGLTLRRAGLDAVAVGVDSMPWVYTPRLLADHDAAMTLAELARKDPYPTSLAGFEAQAAGLRGYDSRPQLPTVTTPTLVLVGAEDVLTPVAQSAEIAALVPSARLQVLPRGGHAMLVEYPDDTLAAITAFLS